MGSKAYGDVVVGDDGGDGGKSNDDGGWGGTHRNIDGTDDDAGGGRGSAREGGETSMDRAVLLHSMFRNFCFPSPAMSWISSILEDEERRAADVAGAMMPSLIAIPPSPRRPRRTGGGREAGMTRTMTRR